MSISGQATRIKKEIEKLSIVDGYNLTSGLKILRDLQAFIQKRIDELEGHDAGTPEKGSTRVD